MENYRAIHKKKEKKTTNKHNSTQRQQIISSETTFNKYGYIMHTFPSKPFPYQISTPYHYKLQ